MYLVVKHSHKLYGPSDFKDERNFMSTLKVPERMKNISSSDQLDSNQLTDAIDSLLNYSSIIGIFCPLRGISVKVIK